MSVHEEIVSQIKTFIDESEKDPYYINDGLCEKLAMSVIWSDEIKEYYDNYEVYELTTGVVEKRPPEKSMKYPGHVWIYNEIDDKHYDAEVPEGVDGFSQLPFFKRLDISVDDIHEVHKDDF